MTVQKDRNRIAMPNRQPSVVSPAQGHQTRVQSEKINPKGLLLNGCHQLS